MDEVSSDELRKQTSTVLDKVFRGESLTITRNRRPVGVLLPVESYMKIRGVTIRELADVLGLGVRPVATLVSQLCKSQGADQIVYQATADNGSAVLTTHGALVVAVALTKSQTQTEG